MSQRRPGIRPRPTLWRRIDAASRFAFPSACTALLLLLLAAPLHVPGQAELQPAAALACVFFWSLFRPGSMTPPRVFLLGVLADLLALGPPGGSGRMGLLSVCNRWLGPVSGRSGSASSPWLAGRRRSAGCSPACSPGECCRRPRHCISSRWPPASTRRSPRCSPAPIAVWPTRNVRRLR